MQATISKNVDVHELFHRFDVVGMSYKHVVTAGDLVRFGCCLKVECTHCGAARTMNGIEVAQVHGTRNFHHLAPRLKCRRCRKKAAKLVVLGPVYPD